MSQSRRRLVGGTALAMYVFSFGVLVGVTVERIRWDEARTAVVRRYERLTAQCRSTTLTTAGHRTHLR
jgi:hypothetical protein